MAIWKLPSEIIKLSDANTWPEAVKEWVPDGVEILEDETDTCLFGHSPIVELCYIRNTKNDNTAIVGNQCIQKFGAEDPAHAVFGDMPKIIASAKRILQDATHGSANSEMIRLAKRKGIFSAIDARFYNKIWRKRNLSVKQSSYKERLNQALLYGVIFTARQAFAHLSTNRVQGTAGPKLIQHAYRKGALNAQSRDFYMQIWQRSHHQLSVKQARWKSSLNQRIITQLRGELS